MQIHKQLLGNHKHQCQLAVSMAFLQDQIYNEELLSKAELCKADSTYLAPEVCEIDLYI